MTNCKRKGRGGGGFDEQDSEEKINEDVEWNETQEKWIAMIANFSLEMRMMSMTEDAAKELARVNKWFFWI